MYDISGDGFREKSSCWRRTMLLSNKLPIFVPAYIRNLTGTESLQSNAIFLHRHECRVESRRKGITPTACGAPLSSIARNPMEREPGVRCERRHKNLDWRLVAGHESAIHAEMTTPCRDGENSRGDGTKRPRRFERISDRHSKLLCSKHSELHLPWNTFRQKENFPDFIIPFRIVSTKNQRLC
jgi:hypothetical protein